jgi:hypothetical protein
MSTAANVMLFMEGGMLGMMGILALVKDEDDHTEVSSLNDPRIGVVGPNVSGRIWDMEVIEGASDTYGA